MQDSPPEVISRFIWMHIFSLVLWLAFCMGIAATVVTLNIRAVEADLSQYGDAYSDRLNKEMVANEAILRGFAALFGVVGRTEPEKAARYVRQVIGSNSQIFALEIVQKVEKDELDAFVAGKRRDGLPSFAVKSFSYDSERKWETPGDKPLYYPIVFMEPMPPGSEDVLGLDMDSVPLLGQAMNESLRRRSPVASHPFRLVEGNLAYVVFCPIERADQDGEDRLLVSMVVDALKLAMPDRLPLFDGGTLLVHHRDFRPDDRAGQLLAISGKGRSLIETMLFPDFVYARPLATMGEPFALVVKRQAGWSDLNLGLLTLLAVLTLVSSLMLAAYLRARRIGQILEVENQKRLWQLANHDALTGLPNRMLLMDRMLQRLAHARRQGRRLAVMFIDLDEFKQVNDNWGHEAGDQLLRFVAERLRASVRADDTVARMSGDEFIVLIEDVESQETIEAVRHKIRQALAEGFAIEGQPIPVRASVGVAMFPEDGDNPDALVKQADLRMYADKQARETRLRPA